jgi:hypothetical protein
MNAFEYFQKYGRIQQGSTIATRRATAQDIQAARTDNGVDYHVDIKTEQE